jgi:hypothetical protein
MNMAPNEIHLNDIGTIFEVTLQDDTVAVDLSTATTLEMVFLKPSGTKVTQTAALSGDGTDGKIRYVSVSGDLDETGVWDLQAHVVLDSDNEFRSSRSQFRVYPNL